MAKQNSSGWLDQFVSKVPKTFGKGVAASDIAQSKPGPVFLGNPYAKEMAKRQTYISPYDAEQKASPAMQQVFAEKADTQAKKKRIRNFLEEQQDVLGKAEMLSLIPTPFTEAVGGVAGITNAAISAALAGQDFSEGNYASALGNFATGALGAGAGATGIRGGLNNVIDDLLPTKGPKNFMTGQSMSSTPGTLGEVKPLLPHEEIGFHAFGENNMKYVSDRELKEAYEEALDKLRTGSDYKPGIDPFLDHDMEKALALDVRMKFADRLPKFTDTNYAPSALQLSNPSFLDARGPYSERFFNQQGYDLTKFNPQERALMDSYQYGYDAYFNKRPNVHKLPASLKNYFGELSDQFNTAVQKNKITKDITLNRSVSDYVLDYWDPVSNKSIGRGLRQDLRVGDVYKDEGFISTSLPHYKFGHSGNFQDKIIVPGGGVQSYVFPNASSYSNFQNEQEVILPKGLIRRVEDFSEPGNIITSIVNPYKNGGQLDKLEQGGWLDKYQDGGWTVSPKVAAYNKAARQTPTDIDANAMQALEQVTSYPQRKITELVTGKNQYPSQAMGITNPYGAFAVDAILDPTNIVGAGLVGKAIGKGAKNITKVTKAGSKGKDAVKLTRAAVPNPLALLDQAIPRLDPIKAMGVEMDIMDLSPLNLIPGYGKKLSGQNQTFRKFGNSLDDVIQRQALSPAGGSDLFRMGKNQIVSEGNWAARNQPSENYPGVFEATFDMNNPNANLSALQIPNRSGVLMVDRQGRRLPEIPITEPGMSFNRRLPFSTRYVPIDKTKLMNNEFQLATQLPHLQSLAEKYGLALGGAGLYGYMRGGEEGAKEKIDFINRYTVDPVLDVFKGGVDKATELLPEKKNGGWLDKYNDGGPVQPNYNDASVSMSKDFVGDGYSNVGRNYSPAWGGQFAMGGSLPGSVGFTYARTIGPPAPSNGKYAKKTKASAQDGANVETVYSGMLPEITVVGSKDPQTEEFYRNMLDRLSKEEGVSQGIIPNDSSEYDIAFDDPISTNNILGRYQGLMDLGKKYGFPKVHPKDPNSIFAIASKLSDTELDLGPRPNYNPFTKTIQASTSKNWLNEMAHHVQFKNNPISTGSKFLTNDVPAYIFGKSPYRTSGTMEHEAHSIIEPKLEEEIETSKRNYRQLPYIQKLTEQFYGPIENYQNGGEMRYYQEGLDFKPKTISRDGGWLSKYEEGGVIQDDMGQWAHPGEITKIGSNQITMQGVPYPVLGISDTGDVQMMYPDEEYEYDGSSVTEYPMMAQGGQLTKLDQLTNFTNYNTKQPGGWLDKYQ
jgi:hypothetical protein